MQACFHGRHCYIEVLRYLLHGTFTSQKNLNGCPQLGFKPLDRAHYIGPTLLLRPHLFWIESHILQFERTVAVPLVDRRFEKHFSTNATSTKDHQRGVDGNPRQPGGDSLWDLPLVRPLAFGLSTLAIKPEAGNQEYWTKVLTHTFVFMGRRG